ncbi:MAG: amidohydrolase [Thermoanaerobaculia bacterium]
MRSLAYFLATAVLCGATPHSPLFAQTADQLIDKQMPSILDTYRQLHAAPELSYFEEKSAAYLVKELRAAGFEVTENVGKYPVPKLRSYGFVALLRNGKGPTVLVRTDLDGLPVEEQTGLPYASKVRMKNERGDDVPVMQACGHDIHMSTFLTTARVLVQLKHRWHGTLMMVGQPAEERGTGAKAMLADGLYERFPRPDYALAIHDNAVLPAGTIGWVSGPAMASVDSVDVTIRGAGGHGAYPHATIDPIVLAAETILLYQTIVSREISPLDPSVVTVGSIHGGTKHNIIPDEVKLQLTVRSYKKEVRDHIIGALGRIAAGVAQARGVPQDRMPIVSVEDHESIPACINDAKLVDRLVPVFTRALGAANVIHIEPVMGGEDFGLFALPGHDIPAFLFNAGAVEPAMVAAAAKGGPSLPSLHSSRFAPVPEPTIRTGARAMVAAVLDLMP